MKFIRDIISEKARLTAERAAALPLSESNLFQSQTEDQSPESELDSADANPSSTDPLETTSVSDGRAANPISWDALGSDENLESDADPSVINFLLEAEPDFEGEADSSSDEDARNLFDAVDTMGVEDLESVFQHDVQNAAQLDAEDAPDTTDRGPFIGADLSGLETSNHADDIEALSILKNRGPATQFVPPHGNENGVSPASGEIPAVPAPQLEQPSAPRADASKFVSGLSEMVNVPAPAVGRGAARAGRVKTRLLGFNPGQSAASDPFEKRTQQSSAGFTQFPVGWLIVVDGPGQGSAFTLFDGVSPIGRGSDQTVCLDFGDNSISRENHAVVAYDSETRKFFLGHGGKTNLVRLENRPVLSTEEIVSGNTIRIGETTLRFVGLCGNDFQWQKNPREDRQNASFS